MTYTTYEEDGSHFVKRGRKFWRHTQCDTKKEAQALAAIWNAKHYAALAAQAATKAVELAEDKQLDFDQFAQAAHSAVSVIDAVSDYGIESGNVSEDDPRGFLA